jgi:glucose-6-phosphate isomerase
VTTPIDPTTTAAWTELTTLAEALEPDLRRWFADDPGRVARFSFEAADLHVDLSKNLVDDRIVAALLRLAEETGVADRYAAMLRGEHINTTEDRAVLHTALRRPAGASRAERGRPRRRCRRAVGPERHGRLRRARALGRMDGHHG